MAVLRRVVSISAAFIRRRFDIAVLKSIVSKRVRHDCETGNFSTRYGAEGGRAVTYFLLAISIRIYTQKVNGRRLILHEIGHLPVENSSSVVLIEIVAVKGILHRNSPTV